MDWQVVKVDQMKVPIIQAVLIINKAPPIKSAHRDQNFGFSLVTVKVWRFDSVGAATKTKIPKELASEIVALDTDLRRIFAV